MREEVESWVPREAALKGLSFFTSRLPNTPQHVLHEFLRSMNSLWHKREKRKMKRVKDAYLIQIQDLKRQIQNSKPYRGVIAERRIRMLKNQVDKERGKKLQGRPLIRNVEDDWDEDVEFTQDAPREQLLHASLSTLETMGRHALVTSEDLSYRGTGKTGMYPHELYLQGALWLGRNFVMLSEEMVEQMEIFRSRVLQEINSILEDASDSQTSVNRLSLLAGSTVTESVEISNRHKYRSREMLSGAASIKPGDYQAMNLFLRNLPIDSLLEKSNFTSSFGAVDGSSFRSHIPRPLSTEVHQTTRRDSRGPIVIPGASVTKGTASRKGQSASRVSRSNLTGANRKAASSSVSTSRVGWK